jgi:hypothetical protein
MAIQLVGAALLAVCILFGALANVIELVVQLLGGE